VKDIVSTLSAVVTVSIAAFAAARSVEWTRANRLRSRLKRDLALMKELGETPCSSVLMRDHIEREVRFLDRTSRVEEMRYQSGLRRSVANVVAGLTIFAISLIGLFAALPGSPWAPEHTSLTDRVGLGLEAVGGLAVAFLILGSEGLARMRAKAEKGEKISKTDAAESPPRDR
jgi:hypothetical protein